ncbi:ankyrin repeat domain-containing protein, partial [Brachyspira pulli]
MRNIFIILLVFCVSVYAQDIIEEVIEEIERIEEIHLSETNNNINKNYNSIYEAIDNDDVEYNKRLAPPK